MWKNLPKNITCITPSFRYFLPDYIRLNYCKDTKEMLAFVSIFTNFFRNIVERPHLVGCPVPCQQIHYKISVDYIHENVLQLWNERGKKLEFFLLQYWYSTLSVEERVESYDYDIGSFLAAVGGNLGLFLGFSCLPILLVATKWIKKYLLKL